MGRASKLDATTSSKDRESGHQSSSKVRSVLHAYFHLEARLLAQIRSRPVPYLSPTTSVTIAPHRSQMRHISRSPIGDTISPRRSRPSGLTFSKSAQTGDVTRASRSGSGRGWWKPLLMTHEVAVASSQFDDAPAHRFTSTKCFAPAHEQYYTSCRLARESIAPSGVVPWRKSAFLSARASRSPRFP